MSNEKRPYVWQMIRQAVEALGTPTTNVAVRNWVQERYPGTNTSTIQCHIISCTVNHDSRIHYQKNQKRRGCDGPYDFLYRPEPGKLERYDPRRHGRWEIAEHENGSLHVRPVDSEPPPGDTEVRGGFVYEAHLRAYLVQHLDDIEGGLTLYTDDHGTDGVEFTTPIGRIDILARDRNNLLVVIELKVGHGPDAVCGQLMRYMGWVKHHMAKGQPVRGMIIAQRISDKIRYALADVPNAELKEYELSLKLRDAEPLA